jgi:hypothetical protein
MCYTLTGWPIGHLVAGSRYRRLDYGAREKTGFKTKAFDEDLAGVGRRRNVIGDGRRRIGRDCADGEGIVAATHAARVHPR